MNFTIYNKLKTDLPDAFDDIMVAFIHETELRIDEITQQIQQKQFDTAILLAHSLKSSSASLGAISLSKCSLSLELVIKEQNYAAAATLATELRGIFTETQSLIEEYQAEHI